MKTPAALMLCTLMVSCAGTHACTTSCGLVTDTLPKDWTCADVQRTETVALKAFSKTLDTRLTRCELFGYRLETVDAGSWLDPDGKRVNGLTYCDFKEIKVGNQPPKQSALVHELAHALQNCTPLPPGDTKDYYHSNWGRDGIFEAIELAQETL